MQWLNETPVWQADKGCLRVVTGPKIDFWRVTHYGFVQDNGHFYHEQRAGDFTITAVKHFLLGSTTERVVRLAPCPVLVVREEERDFVS